jgi:glycosyltransferase involved in cell wall biosynthesis
MSARTYIANSSVVAERIRSAYGIEAQIVFPPTSLSAEDPQTPINGLNAGFWLTVSRGRGYKNVGIVADAISKLGDGQLVVVGHNPAPATNFDPRYVKFLGEVSDAQLRWLYANARALVTLAFEDFGLTPLEANTFGTPVAALRAGGHLDTVAEGVSGWWIEEPTAAGAVSALRQEPTFDKQEIVAHARRFAPEVFSEKIDKIVTDSLARRQ